MNNINPAFRAEMDIAGILRGALPVERQAEVLSLVMACVKQALEAERLLAGAHQDCGADNPTGLPAKCTCPCHKGHFKHAWQPVIKTPVLNPDNTYHLLDRCRYCPDLRLKIIKSDWVKEACTAVSLEFHIRGEQQVLAHEDWQRREIMPVDPKIIRRAKL